MNFLDLFKDSKHTQSFKAGDIIFQEGFQGDYMYVVLEGQVRLSRNNRVLDLVKPGEILGEMALIDTRTRSATAIVEQDCCLALVDEKEFTFLVQQTPYFALHVMNVLVDRLRRMDALVDQL